jgi:hypothetical protein
MLPGFGTISARSFATSTFPICIDGETGKELPMWFIGFWHRTSSCGCGLLEVGSGCLRSVLEALRLRPIPSCDQPALTSGRWWLTLMLLNSDGESRLAGDACPGMANRPERRTSLQKDHSLGPCCSDSEICEESFWLAWCEVHSELLPGNLKPDNSWNSRSCLYGLRWTLWGRDTNYKFFALVPIIMALTFRVYLLFFSTTNILYPGDSIRIKHLVCFLIIIAHMIFGIPPYIGGVWKHLTLMEGIYPQEYGIPCINQKIECSKRASCKL